MTDNDPGPTNEAACPHCQATTAAAKAEIAQVAKACIEELGRVTDSVIGLVREAHASEQVALHAWKAATENRDNGTPMTDPTTHTLWRLQFETDDREFLTPERVLIGNEKLKPNADGRWEHTITLPIGEAAYRELAAEAVRKGARNVRLSKRTVVSTYSEWAMADAEDRADAAAIDQAIADREAGAKPIPLEDLAEELGL
jgi:hypothetical protein